MRRRTRVVGILLSLLAGLVGAGYHLYVRWTDPEAAPAVLVEDLGAPFACLAGSVASAHLPRVGGVHAEAVQRSSRAHHIAGARTTLPWMILSPDKEQLARG